MRKAVDKLGRSLSSSGGHRRIFSINRKGKAKEKELDLENVEERNDDEDIDASEEARRELLNGAIVRSVIAAAIQGKEASFHCFSAR